MVRWLESLEIAYSRNEPVASVIYGQVFLSTALCRFVFAMAAVCEPLLAHFGLGAQLPI
jgi:hypothetical protein